MVDVVAVMDVVVADVVVVDAVAAVVVVVAPQCGAVGFARHAARSVFRARRQAARQTLPASPFGHGCRHTVASCRMTCLQSFGHLACAAEAARTSTIANVLIAPGRRDLESLRRAVVSSAMVQSPYCLRTDRLVRGLPVGSLN